MAIVSGRLHDLLVDQSAIDFHVDRAAARLETEDHDVRDQAESVMRRELLRAREIYPRQVLISLVSILEAIVKDFFVCAFLSSPVRCHDYLGSKEQGTLGTVNLRRIVESFSLGDLFDDIAHEAASQATRGKITVVASRIQRLSGYALDPGVIEDVQSLQNQRNLILHDLLEPELGAFELHDAFNAAETLLREVGLAAQRAAVPLADNAHLLDRPRSDP
jgi:hypothetical protein